MVVSVFLTSIKYPRSLLPSKSILKTYLEIIIYTEKLESLYCGLRKCEYVNITF